LAVTTKNNFVVITGGPGAGKTTLLEALSRRGYNFVGETARTIIRERLSRGLSPRPEPAEFARQIFEVDLNNYRNHINTEQLVFFDRSFLDSAAMLFEASTTEPVEIAEALKNYRFRRSVFIAPPWEEIYTNDNERDQTFGDGVAVYEKLHRWYEQNDYELIEIPKDSVDDRVRFILERIQ